MNSEELWSACGADFKLGWCGARGSAQMAKIMNDE